LSFLLSRHPASVAFRAVAEAKWVIHAARRGLNWALSDSGASQQFEGERAELRQPINDETCEERAKLQAYLAKRNSLVKSNPQEFKMQYARASWPARPSRASLRWMRQAQADG
jgi:hypothetical protein